MSKSMKCLVTGGAGFIASNLVDRLLAAPDHAERMTSIWLDNARYADSNGYQLCEHRLYQILGQQRLKPAHSRQFLALDESGRAGHAHSGDF